ncbi:glycosyltransferase family 2 protein [Streptomyces sp. NPDC049555]|uniref:glycosyltransferase n=1 Tax=unclassified Streptomyces TaxID=2593676 RepID=UPI00343BA7AE
MSVVIPARNAQVTLPAQLEALAGQDRALDWEVVVVANACRDETAALARAWVPRLPALTVVILEKPGVNRARNAGCQAARAEVILLCDADDVVAPGWIKAMADGLCSYDIVSGAMDPALLNGQAAQAARRPPATHALENHHRFLPYVKGGNCGFRKELWHALGGFDPAYRRGGDDIEFSWRAQLAGFSIGFVPAAVIHYRYRPDALSAARQGFGYGRARPRLYRDFRLFGLPRTGIRASLTAWAWLAAHPHHLLRRHSRIRWCTSLAQQTGRLIGCLQHRVFDL